MNKCLSLLALLVTLCSLPATAWAETYVCAVNLNSNSGTDYGKYGYVYAHFTDQPLCQGNYLFTRYYCSKGATSRVCGKFETLRFDAHNIGPFAQMLQTQAKAGHQVYAGDTYCNVTNEYGCGSLVTVWPHE